MQRIKIINTIKIIIQENIPEMTESESHHQNTDQDGSAAVAKTGNDVADYSRDIMISS